MTAIGFSSYELFVQWAKHIHFFNRYCHFLQKVTFSISYNFRSVFDDFVFLLVHGFWLLFFQNYDLLAYSDDFL